MSDKPAFIGAFEAKNTLGRLLDRVAEGEAIVITRHGAPVARLVPYEQPSDRDDALRAAHELRALRSGNVLPAGVTLRDLKDDGRR